MPSLRTLLERDDLGLRLVTGDPDTAFDGVRLAERDADRPWLAPGDLRLSEAGFALPRPAPDPLFDPPPRVLAYALTPQRRSLPAGLVERADAAGVALVAVPPRVNLGRLEEAAMVALARGASEAIGAGAAAQRLLLRALDGPKPERDLLERLHRLTGGAFVLLAPWNAVLARAGDASWRGPAGGAATLPEGRARLGGREAWVLRVHGGGRLRSVLVAFEPAAGGAGVLGAGDGARPDAGPGGFLAWLELARGLLAVAALGRSAEASGEQARRAALLAEWLAGPQAAAMLAPRLRAAGFEPGSPFVVAVAESGPRLRPGRTARSLPERLERLRSAGEELFLSLGVGVLSEAHSDHALWVFGGGEPAAHAPALHAALRAAAACGAEVRLGLSLVRSDATDVADAYRQALLALQGIAVPDGVAHFDTFDPVYWVMAQQPEDNLRALRDRLLGRLSAADGNGKLRRTLAAYLRSPSDMGALADELHIHVNTLRYRLRRIEDLIQQPLARPETLARLYLAEQVDGMLDRP